MKNKQVNFRIDPETLRRLRDLQRIERRSTGSLLCVLIDAAWYRNDQTLKSETKPKRKV